MLSIDRAQVGDVLFLTKPLGTGVMNQALRKAQLSETSRTFQQALASMEALNAEGARAARLASAHAATDITGFGLLGHAAQFATASKVTFVIERSRVPFFEGVEALVSSGVVPGRCRDNADAYAAMVEGITSAVDSTLLHDAQTSGGLLVAVPRASAPRFVEALAGWPHGAVEIGAVISKASRAVRLR